MLEKAVVTALIGMFASVGYVEVADHADDILQEANLVAAATQERELTLALELYYLDYGSYPTVSDEEVVEELYRSNLLKEDDVPFEVAYTDLKKGRDYNLSVK